MYDLGCVSAPPTLLHLSLMVDEADGEVSGQKTSLTLLLQLLPELSYQLEIPDHLGKLDTYIYTYMVALCLLNRTHIYMHIHSI